MNAQELINTKEILTNEEREIVLAFDPKLDREFLFKLHGDRGWLNTNVYSEHEHEEHQFRRERGY